MGKADSDKKRTSEGLDPVFPGLEDGPEQPMPLAPEAGGLPPENSAHGAGPFFMPAFSLGISQEVPQDTAELMGLGMSEAPPPFEVVEEL